MDPSEWMPSFYDYDSEEESMGSYVGRKQAMAEYMEEIYPDNWQDIIEAQEELYLRLNGLGFNDPLEAFSKQMKKKNEKTDGGNGSNVAGGSGSSKSEEGQQKDEKKKAGKKSVNKSTACISCKNCEKRSKRL
jgi:hypothetical protein